MGAAAILLAAGTAVSVYGNIKASQDQARAMEQQAQLNELQAQQTEQAGYREIELTRLAGERFKGGQVAAVGQSGTTLSGSNLMALENTAASIHSEIAARESEVRYRANIARIQGSSLNQQAGQVRQAGYINAAGSILTSTSRNPYINDSGKQI